MLPSIPVNPSWDVWAVLNSGLVNLDSAILREVHFDYCSIRAITALNPIRAMLWSGELAKCTRLILEKVHHYPITNMVICNLCFLIVLGFVFSLNLLNVLSSQLPSCGQRQYKFLPVVRHIGWVDEMWGVESCLCW